MCCFSPCQILLYGQGILEKFAVLEDSGGKYFWDFFFKLNCNIHQGKCLSTKDTTSESCTAATQVTTSQMKIQWSPSPWRFLLRLPRPHPLPQRLLWFLSPCVALPVLNFVKMGTMPIYPFFFFFKSASLTHVQACISSILMCLALVWSLYYHGEFHRRDALRDLYPFSHWWAFGLLAVRAAVTKTSRTSLLVLVTFATHGE